MARKPHPLVNEFLEELDAQRTSDPDMTVASVTDAAGLARMSVTNWRNGHVPRVSNLDRALRVLGYRLTVVPVASD